MVFLRGKQLHVMPKRHQSKASLKDCDSSVSQVLCSPAALLSLVMIFFHIQTYTLLVRGKRYLVICHVCAEDSNTTALQGYLIVCKAHHPFLLPFSLPQSFTDQTALSFAPLYKAYFSKMISVISFLILLQLYKMQHSKLSPSAWFPHH